MDEYLKSVKLNPVILYKEDLYELEKIFREDTSIKKEDLEINFYNKDKLYTFNSFEDFFNNINLQKAKSISIKIFTMAPDSNSIKRISLRIYESLITYDINSTNQIWFLGKISQIKDFFKERQPWYSFITKYLVYICSLLFGFLFVTFWGNSPKLKSLLLIWLILLFAYCSIGYLSLANRIFPYTSIFLYSKNQRKLDPNIIITIVFGVVSIIVSIIGIVVPYLKK